MVKVISDLLKPERTNLVIREDRKRGVFVDGLSEWVVRSPQEVRLEHLCCTAAGCRLQAGDASRVSDYASTERG